MSPQEATRWFRVILLVGAGVVAAFQVGKVPPVLPLLRTELGLTLVLAGWVISAFNALGIILGPTAGVLADWLGHRRLILGGLICLALNSFLGSLAQGPALLLLSRFGEGLGYVLVLVSVPSLVVRVTQAQDLRLALGIWGAFMPAGMSTMLVISPWLAEVWDWQGVWQANGVFLLGYASALAWFTRDLGNTSQRNVQPKALLGNIFKTMTSPGPALVALCFGSYSLQYLSVFGFLPTLLIEDMGLSPGRAALLTALAVAANVPGNLAGGWLMQRGLRSSTLMALVCVIIGSCSFGIFTGLLPFLLRFLLCVVFSMAGGMLPAASMVAAVVLAPRPDLVATSNGVILQGAQLGSMAGPPLLAMIVSTSGGWDTAPWLLAASACLGIILSFILRAVEPFDPQKNKDR
ncbi:MAG: MFS transporter [Desulfarculaceae bacterium]|jgi:predicted MFS family arabinose efflux permease